MIVQSALKWVNEVKLTPCSLSVVRATRQPSALGELFWAATERVVMVKLPLVPPSQLVSTAPRLKLCGLVMITSTAPAVAMLVPEVGGAGAVEVIITKPQSFSLGAVLTSW